tara:strand:- start:132706 stop:132831 length:126 start_codon:yes stop_codon:yes gene_type:complete
MQQSLTLLHLLTVTIKILLYFDKKAHDEKLAMLVAHPVSCD